MSRSRWKTPIVPWCHRSSCKGWRTQENRRYRAYVRDHIAHERYDSIQGYCGRFGNEWDSPRDGKGWIGEMKYRKCPYYRYLYNGQWHGCETNIHFCSKYYWEMMRK